MPSEVPTLFQGKVTFADTVTFSKKPSLPNATILDKHVDADADIAATKCEQQIERYHAITGNVAAATVPLHGAIGATGVVVSARVILTSSVPTSTNAYAVDLRKNFSTVLTSTITVDSTALTDTWIPLTIDGDEEDYVADDYFDLTITSVSGTGWGAGFLAQVIFREEAAP